MARRYDFYVRVAIPISHSFAALTPEILFLLRENKIHIFEVTYNVLFFVRRSHERCRTFPKISEDYFEEEPKMFRSKIDVSAIYKGYYTEGQEGQNFRTSALFCPAPVPCKLGDSNHIHRQIFDIFNLSHMNLDTNRLSSS